MAELISFMIEKKNILNIYAFDEITDISYCFCFNNGMPASADDTSA